MDPKNHTQRPQYNYQYTHPQGARPSYPRPQQSATCPPLMYQPAMPVPPRFYPYMGPHYVGYNNPPSHTPPYYYAPNRPLTSMPSCSNSGNNVTSMVQNIPPTTVPQTAQMHQPVPGMHQAVTKRSHRLAIIDPVTQQDILCELSKEKLLAAEGDKKAPHTDTHARNIAQEFSRIVYEAANSSQDKLKANDVPKSTVSPITSSNQPENTIKNINSINNNVKSELIVNNNSHIMPNMSVNDKTMQNSGEMCINQPENPMNSNNSGSDLIIDNNSDTKMSVNVKTMQTFEETSTNNNEITINISNSITNNEKSDLTIDNNSDIIVPKNVKPMESEDTNRIINSNNKEQIINNSASTVIQNSEKNKSVDSKQNSGTENSKSVKKGDIKMDVASPVASINVRSLAIPTLMPQSAAVMPQSTDSMPQSTDSMPQSTDSMPQPTDSMPQSAAVPVTKAVIRQPPAVMPVSIAAMPIDSIPLPSVSMPQMTDSMRQSTVLKHQSAVIPQPTTVMSVPAAVMPVSAAVMPQPDISMPKLTVSMRQSAAVIPQKAVVPQSSTLMPVPIAVMPVPSDSMPQLTDSMRQSAAVTPQTDKSTTSNVLASSQPQRYGRESEEKKVKEVAKEKEFPPPTTKQYSSVLLGPDPSNESTSIVPKTEDAKVYTNSNYKTVKKKNRRKAAKMASNKAKELTSQDGIDEADKVENKTVNATKQELGQSKDKTDLEDLNKIDKNVNKEAVSKVTKLESDQNEIESDKVITIGQNEVKNDQNSNKREVSKSQNRKDETDQFININKSNKDKNGNKNVINNATKESESGQNRNKTDKLIEDINKSKETKNKSKTAINNEVTMETEFNQDLKDEIKVTEEYNKNIKNCNENAVNSVNKELESQRKDATIDFNKKDKVKNRNRNKKTAKTTAVSKDVTNESSQNQKIETENNQIINKVITENIAKDGQESLNRNDKIIQEFEAKSIKKDDDVTIQEKHTNQEDLENNKNTAKIPKVIFDVTNIPFKINLKQETHKNNAVLINDELKANINSKVDDVTPEDNKKSVNSESESSQEKDENKTVEMQISNDFYKTLSIQNLKYDKNKVIIQENVGHDESSLRKDEVIVKVKDNINVDTQIETVDKSVDESVDKPVDDTPTSALKYKYNDDQWSPLNRNGKMYYDLRLLMQIKENPMSKRKPNVPIHMETCFVMRTTPMPEILPFTPYLRPMEDSFMPQFGKSAVGMSWNLNTRDMKRDGRMASGKGSMKLPPSTHKPVIHVSLSLRNEVKLNETESAWKPTRFTKEELPEEELKTQELYKKFRGILNKLTPQKFDTLLEKVKALSIDNEKRLQGVIDLIFEKAIEEPNFSEAYAAMCSKLSMIKVPAENATNPEHSANFRALIITKCQHQFQTNRTDEQILKLEKEIEACTDPTKMKELQLMLQEENRRVRMRSVGNVRFIGELYKLKMLTLKIMLYCTNYLIENHEEDKLECLCKLLTTIGQQIENEGPSQLDLIFKKMLEITKVAKISSRVRFMILDVIELRKRRWVKKGVVDLQPKTMDQIQKEAELQHRHIEIMNTGPSGGSHREDGRGKRDNRRQNYLDNNWKPTKTTNFPVDTSKLKAVSQKNLINIKLAPHQSAWNHGSGTKTQPPCHVVVKPASNTLMGLNKNMYSVLDQAQTEPSVGRDNRNMTQSYNMAPKGASIERSTFHSRDINMAQPSSGSKSQHRTKLTAPEPLPFKIRYTEEKESKRGQSPLEVPRTVLEEPLTVPQEPLTEKMENSVKCAIDQYIMSDDVEELCADVTQMYHPRFHSAVIALIVDITGNKNPKEVGIISKALLHLVATNTISVDNLLSGLKDTFEFAPDIYIDVPMLYCYLGMIVAPHIEKKHITFSQIFNLSKNIISENQGNLLLKAIISNMYENMGATFVTTKWLESGMELKQWMEENQVSKWIEENKFHFLEGHNAGADETKGKLTPQETRTKLLQLMRADEDCKCIQGWIQDKLGSTANQNWFLIELIQAIIENAYINKRLNQERMNKYIGLLEEFGEKTREDNCLVGAQRLVHRLEHPQGLTLEIFQYLNENYIISLDGFLSWEKSDKEPEGKGVMLVALTSFFNSIKEENEDDSCSED